MTIIKGVEKVVKAEGFDFNTLKGVVKSLNEAGVLAKSIKVVAVPKDKLASDFMQGIESVKEGSEEEKLLPKEAVKLYNDYVDIIEGKGAGSEVSSEGEALKEEGKKKKVEDQEKGKRVKKGSGLKKEVSLAKGRSPQEKDVYGFRLNSKMHLVALVVEGGGVVGVTVKDVKDAPWNVRKNAYKSYWMKMVDGGFAKCKDGRIFISSKKK